jgi:hypothetical protein
LRTAYFDKIAEVERNRSFTYSLQPLLFVPWIDYVNTTESKLNRSKDFSQGRLTEVLAPQSGKMLELQLHGAAQLMHAVGLVAIV